LAPQPRFPFLPTMGLLLLLGFGGTSALSYFSARGTLNRQLANSTLPLTARAVSADLERSLTRPVLVSSSMARNTFLQRWLADGEQEQDEMVAYLRNLRSQFRATTAFFVSERSRRYYHPDGVLKTVSPSDPGDRWYFRLRDAATPFEVNIDRDTADPDRVTAFSNFPVLERELARELTSHRQRHGTQVLLVARDGRVLLAPSGTAAAHTASRLQEVSGLAPHAARLLRDPEVALQFRHGQGELFVNSRQIPELGWVMVVLQQTDPHQGALLPILGQNLLIALLVSGVVLLLANATVGSYQRRLQRLANTDKLTGLLNRTAFDPLFGDLVQEAIRRQQPLALLLLDIDFFKAINDTHGHVIGDQVIQHVAARLEGTSLKGEHGFRWGGEEFLILMPGCTAAQAVARGEALQRALRLEPVQHGPGAWPDAASNPLLAPTISCGVTSYQLGETDQELLVRADRALYQAKHEGRDRVVCLDQGESPVQVA
jgi:diguanylate cyclase (GGDEF)-like protein